MSVVSFPGTEPLVAPGGFVGRDREMERLGQLLSGTARLITLVGPGGIGKTRLAAEALRSLHRGEQRPMYWSGLADIERDSDTVEQDVLRSVGRTDVTDPSTLDMLVRRFTDGACADRSILVLDNCEHVLAGVGRVVTALLGAVPGLTILATSREPLGWVDEYLLTVPPLPPRHALELFRQRAELTGRPIPDEPGVLAIAAQICRHVDHSPLFIQLAAARLRHRSAAMVLGELTGDADDKRMRWSHSARSGIAARHRGVYDVLAWSFELCSEPERMLLERMSVFAAGYETDGAESLRNGIDLDAVVAVCADPVLPAEQVEHLLERLVERSLVSAHITETRARWYLVESVRVFAWGRLRRHDPDLASRLAGRHRRYYRDRVVAGQSLRYGPREQAWLTWARSSWDNILLGIETGPADPGEAMIGLETAGVLLSRWFPFRATSVLGWHALWRGRGSYAGRLLDGCAATDCLPGPEPRLCLCDTADSATGLPAAVEWIWGLELMLIGVDPRAITVLERASRKFAASGDRVGAERSEVLLALASAVLGDREQALASTERYLLRSESSGSPMSLSWAQIARAVALAEHGRVEEAMEMTHLVLTRYGAEEDTWTTNWAVGARIVALARLLTDRAHSGRAAADLAADTARLIGGYKAGHRSVGIEIDGIPMVAAGLRRAVAAACAVIGEQAYAAAERDGAVFEPESGELPRFAAATPPPAITATPRPQAPQLTCGLWSALSRAEREVAVFAAAGWPNSAIADERRSSVRTVDAQVASIRQKLMISSRNDIVRYVPDELAERVRCYASERRRGRRSARRSAQRQV